jgi:hypothetical protein
MREAVIVGRWNADALQCFIVLPLFGCARATDVGPAALDGVCRVGPNPLPLNRLPGLRVERFLFAIFINVPAILLTRDHSRRGGDGSVM